MKAKKLIETLSQFDGEEEVFGVSTIDNVVHLHYIDAAILAEGSYSPGKQVEVSGILVGSNLTIDSIKEKTK